MKFKKILLLIIITIFICSVSSANATEKEYNITCPEGSDHNVTFQESIIKTYDNIVKQNDWYYKQYLIENTTYSFNHKNSSNITCIYGYNDINYSYEYEKLPSTYVIKKTSKSALTASKTTYVKGTIYKYYKETTKILYANTKTKTVTKYDKIFSGYYKTIKIPTLKIWGYKNFKFKYEKIQIGRTNYNYFITGLFYPDDLRVKGAKYTKKYGSYFFKYKPYKITIYI